MPFKAGQLKMKITGRKGFDKVTCRFTVDNQLRYMAYNGNELYNDGGDKADWTKPKTVVFEAERCNPGVLEIRGFNWEGHPEGRKYRGHANAKDGCLTGGVLVSCTAPAGSPWNNFGTNVNRWRAVGVEMKGTKSWRKPHPEDKPCVSKSGFSLKGNKYG